MLALKKKERVGEEKSGKKGSILPSFQVTDKDLFQVRPLDGNCNRRNRCEGKR